MTFIAGLIVGIFIVLAMCIGIAWVVESNNLSMTRFFAPQYAQVERQTFEQSRSFNQGMIQELQNMQFEYVKADAAHKKALASIILHRAADYDETKLPADLRAFLHDLKRERTKY